MNTESLCETFCENRAVHHKRYKSAYDNERAPKRRRTNGKEQHYINPRIKFKFNVQNFKKIYCKNVTDTSNL